MSAASDFAIELEVDALEAHFKSVVTDHLVGSWQAQRDGHAAPASPAVLADERLWRRLVAWRGRVASSSLLGRRVDMLWRLCAEAIVANDLDVVAAAGIETRGGLRAAVMARNRVARRLGWTDYLGLALARDALDKATVDRCIEASARASRRPWQQPPPAPLTPGDPPPVPSEQVILGYVGVTLDARVRIDRSAGSGARAYLVDPGTGDVRLLVGKSASLSGWRELAHELGHAWYASSIDADLPWSLAVAAAPCVDEAVAECFAAVVDSVGFMVGALGMSAERAEELSAVRRRARCCWRRWQLVRTIFERDLYDDPDRDLERRWRQLLDRYVGAGSYPPWHTVEHWRRNPGTQANYLVGDEIYRQLLEPRGWRREVVHGMAAELLRPGASRPWSSLVRSYTQREV